MRDLKVTVFLNGGAIRGWRGHPAMVVSGCAITNVRAVNGGGGISIHVSDIFT